MTISCKCLVISISLSLFFVDQGICQGNVKAIEKTIDEFVQVMNNFDGKAMKSFFVDDDFSKQIEQGYLLTDEIYENLKFEITERNPYVPYYVVTNKKVRITNRNSAVVLCYVDSYHHSKEEKKWQSEMVFLIVLEKIEDKWLFVVVHSSYLTKTRNF